MSPWIILFVLVEVALLLPSLYLLLLTLLSLRYRKALEPSSDVKCRFAILVPAHNEELLLPRLLENLQQITYPLNLFEVFVVADNCSDTTATVARSYGATVFERQDPTQRGKGYALRWLLERISTSSQEYDAYIFLDADSVVSPNFLNVMDCRFRSGSQAVQAYYTLPDPFRTPILTLRFVALVLKHFVRPRGRAVVGLSCGLFGTGMGFKRSLLETHDWNAFTLAEDIEYYLRLTSHGIRVDFAPEATVWAEMPASLGAAKNQILRWEQGRAHMAWRYGLPLFLKGILQADPKKLDAAIEQFIPPLSILMLAAAALLLGSFFTGNVWAVGLAIVTNIALLGHTVIGLASSRAPLPAYRSFVYAPWFIFWKLFVYLLALLPKKRQWVRTQR